MANYDRAGEIQAAAGGIDGSGVNRKRSPPFAPIRPSGFTKRYSRTRTRSSLRKMTRASAIPVAVDLR